MVYEPCHSWLLYICIYIYIYAAFLELFANWGVHKSARPASAEMAVVACKRSSSIAAAAAAAAAAADVMVKEEPEDEDEAAADEEYLPDDEYLGEEFGETGFKFCVSSLISNVYRMAHMVVEKLLLTMREELRFSMWSTHYDQRGPEARNLRHALMGYHHHHHHHHPQGQPRQ